MEKRVFAAIFLSFVVLVIYQNYFVPPVPPPSATPVASQVPPGAPSVAVPPGQPQAAGQAPVGADPQAPVAAVEAVSP